MPKYSFNQPVNTPNGKGLLIGVSKTPDPVSLDISANMESGTIKSFFVSHNARDLTDEQKQNLNWRGGSCITVEYSADQIEGLN